jgi:hypothetical protein
LRASKALHRRAFELHSRYARARPSLQASGICGRIPARFKAQMRPRWTSCSTKPAGP